MDRTWVFETQDAGSNPAKGTNALVAQWIEHHATNVEVGGSSPFRCTKFKKRVL